MKQYSVALCTYNGEKYIAEQLNSIIGQTVIPQEIIISDDGSTDSTLQLVDEILRKSCIKYKVVRNYKKRGVSGNFANAIGLCSSEIVFTSDQDDVWIKNKAEEMLKKFDNNNVWLVFSDGELVDSALKPLGCSMWSSVDLTSNMLNKKDWFAYLLNRCLVTGAAMAFRKELLEQSD